MTMSPFCLIDVAEIRSHATAPHDVRESTWHARLTGWVARLLHVRHAWAACGMAARGAQVLVRPPARL